MSDREFRQERSRFLREMSADISEERSSLVVGRITQPTVTANLLFTGQRVREALSRGVLGVPIVIQPLYMLYVFRQNGQAGMIVNRVSPFQHEQMLLTDLEMDVVMAWAMRMMRGDIGRFTPTDGGWMWWRK